MYAQFEICDSLVNQHSRKIFITTYLTGSLEELICEVANTTAVGYRGDSEVKSTCSSFSSSALLSQHSRGVAYNSSSRDRHHALDSEGIHTYRHTLKYTHNQTGIIIKSFLKTDSASYIPTLDELRCHPRRPWPPFFM